MHNHLSRQKWKGTSGDGLTVSQRYYRRHKEQAQQYRITHREELKEGHRKYYLANKEEHHRKCRLNRLNKIDIYKQKEKEQRIKVKKDVISNYGGKCACCGEERLDFLTVDHVYNNGSEHRRSFGSGQKIHRYLRTHGYPEGYQILCFNCNYSKYYNHGKCIHQIERENIGHVSFDNGLRVG